MTSLYGVSATLRVPFPPLLRLFPAPGFALLRVFIGQWISRRPFNQTWLPRFPAYQALGSMVLCYFLIGNFQYFSFGISTSIRNLLYWKLISILNLPFVSIFIIFCRNPSLEVCKDRCVGIGRSYWRDLAPFRYAFLTKLCLVLVR